MYLDYYDYEMALTLIKDSELKKGVDGVGVVNDTLPGIKASKDTCHCKSLACNCVRNTIAGLPPNGVGLPLEFNLQNLLHNQSYSLENDLMNRLRLQALITSSAVSRDAYASEIFSRSWQPYQPLVTSRDQIDYLRTGKRKKLEDGPILSSIPTVENIDRNFYTSPLPSPITIPSPISAENHKAPISPPCSTSLPSLKKSDKNAKKFVCTDCHKSFDYKHVLINHMRTHTGEKPFCCDICFKRFTRDHHLKTHKRTHTGEKPFKCSYCDLRFGQVANQRRHEKVHTGERPYSCETCPARFPDTTQLKNHKLKHEQFTCEDCNVDFHTERNLINHKCLPNNEVNMDDCKSDDAVSNDSLTTINGYHPQSVPVEVPTEIVTVTIPVQTEPEDLSVKKYRSIINNNSSSSAGDSSRSSSPMDS